jgi:hypothetical protein
MRGISTIMLLGALSLTAGPITYNLIGVTFNDGGTASGSFTFDADAGIPCSGGGPVCGVYSNIDIVTTTGSSVTGATYTFACGQDVPSCTGVPPNSTEVLLLTSNAADQTGLQGFALFFTGVGVAPPGGLSDAGGGFDVSNSSSSVGAGSEALCVDAACSGATTPARSTVAGQVSPEPSSGLLLGASLGMLGLVGFRKFAPSRNA